MNKESSTPEKKNSFESQPQNDRNSSNEDSSSKQDGSMSYKNARSLPQNEKIGGQGSQVGQDRKEHSTDDAKSQNKQEVKKSYWFEISAKF